MVKSYKKETLINLLWLLAFTIFLIHMDYFSESSFWVTVLIILYGRFLYNAFYQQLIVDISIEGDLIVITHFSIVFRIDKTNIKNEDLIELKSKNVDSVEFVVTGTNGYIEKSFYYNVSPWHELSGKLSEIHNNLKALKSNDA